MKYSCYSLCLLFCLVVGCGTQTVPPQPAADGHAFFVHLQDGFFGQLVQVDVDGETVFNGTPKTDPRLALAEAFPSVARSTSIVLVVRIPSKGIASTNSLDLSKANGIGISIIGGEIKIRQANAFGYD